MAPFRAFILVFALLFFFVLVAPLQGLLARRRSPWANRIPLLFCRTLLRILRVTVEVEGRCAAEGPVLLVVNHVSWIDVLALGSLTPFCFLAKSEVASWPILSAFAKVQGTVFVDRSRRRGILPANRDMAARMREGRTVLLFPEGTTFDGRTPGPFLSSHFAAARDLLRNAPEYDHVAIQPTALAYSAARAAWIGDDALVPHLWRVLVGAPLRCRVAFGAPIAYRRETNRKIVARQARLDIAAMVERIRQSRPAYAWTAAVPPVPSAGVEPEARTNML